MCVYKEGIKIFYIWLFLCVCKVERHIDTHTDLYTYSVSTNVRLSSWYDVKPIVCKRIFFLDFCRERRAGEGVRRDVMKAK